jgi:hypothetical protein
MENPISEESARVQLDQLLDFYDVDLDLVGEDGKMKLLAERKLIKAFREERIRIENSAEEFLVVQILRDGTEFVYHELNGMAKVQMERFKGQHERLYGLLAILSKKPITQIQQISGPDLAIAEYLSLIFLAG